MIKSIMEKLFDPGTPSEVRAKMLKFGRENPQYSEAEIVEMFRGSMNRAKKKKVKTDTKTAQKKFKQKEQKRRAEMAYGGSVKGKKHNYAAGGMVKDNAGLRALKKSSPEAYKKITGK